MLQLSSLLLSNIHCIFQAKEKDMRPLLRKVRVIEMIPVNQQMPRKVCTLLRFCKCMDTGSVMDMLTT